MFLSTLSEYFLPYEGVLFAACQRRMQPGQSLTSLLKSESKLLPLARTTLHHSNKCCAPRRRSVSKGRQKWSDGTTTAQRRHDIVGLPRCLDNGSKRLPWTCGYSGSNFRSSLSTFRGFFARYPALNIRFLLSDRLRSCIFIQFC